MAMPHHKSEELIDVRPLGRELSQQRTHALFKSSQLEVMRLVLQQGASFPRHKVPGEITVQCIEGKIDVTTDSGSHILAAGQMLFLSGDVEHGVVAIEAASALVTIVLRPI